MPSNEPLYLGFDLSTQQLKCLAVSSDLKVEYNARFDFDVDSVGFDIRNGVITDPVEHEVYAPVALWLQALDVLLERLQKEGLDFRRVKGISGAGQQHGSVYWNQHGETVLKTLDSSSKLERQLASAFSHPNSPNWQDASTQKECDLFDQRLGNELALALNTGSKAHHRFTGPQILRFKRRNLEKYAETSRISLISSFLASIFLGRIAPIDISDVCGMNLWDIQSGKWNETLLSLASDGDAPGLAQKLGSVEHDGGAILGYINKYFVERYSFSPECQITPFTGDNPATILALPLRPMDAMVSLGTSTTFLMSTPYYKPNPAVHFFAHPTTPGLYMFMLCYKNGGLAREQIRDSINLNPEDKTWTKFDKVASTRPPLGQLNGAESPMTIGLFFPRPEIVPNVRAGTWRFTYNPSDHELASLEEPGLLPEADARCIIESQFLSLRLRSRDLVKSPNPGSNAGREIPPQPRRTYLVGGGSRNSVISEIAGQVLGGVEGVYKLDIGENACALGAAYKAVWALERKTGEKFEELIGGKWKEADFVKRVADGYQEGLWERYGQALEGLEKAETEIAKDG